MITWTTIVVGPDGRRFDLGAGERFPITDSYVPKNAFTEPKKERK